MAEEDSKYSRKELHKGRLKRLAPAFYKGRAYVHWTMVLESRQRGWLNPAHHEKLCWIHLHALARGRLCCPAYCLMPDHAHFVWIGLDENARQKPAITYLQRQWNQLLSPQKLERQPYDSVLKENDRAKDRFADLCAYVLHNPVRSGDCADWTAWPYSGAAFPGYPALDPRKRYFQENFWKAYQEQSV